MSLSTVWFWGNMVVCCIEEESKVEARLACDGLQRLLSRRLRLLPVDCGLLFPRDRVCTVAVVAGLCCSGNVFVKAEAGFWFQGVLLQDSDFIL
ncbi:hypothetical protein Tsubulata_023473 [Turnera subulata]|uniref:Uncharacterized protein n=1 Tax=Turnera subulata TaxID=218843 RepID=A0A9Q0FSY1_9ROSI|nr:hypothetical protein Tsubulata_023473 [Turnera subulata]